MRFSTNRRLPTHRNPIPYLGTEQDNGLQDVHTDRARSSPIYHLPLTLPALSNGQVEEE